jgi:hypothetical protein
MLGSTFNNLLGPAATVRALDTFVMLGANKSKTVGRPSAFSTGLRVFFILPFH